ncbi:MAG: L-2-hydroxyglutarate oxidase [Thermoanaerobaculia bacterium]|nr:L-2-hydroxyglutarate oxidase [Thermoanaerobaculia bacterium]
MKTYDILIVGGGIVGLATAYQLLKRRPALRVAVLEKENRVAQHQSSRNSGVLHSGIYYRPGSLRARNCLRGYALMLDFCREYGLPFDVCGKIIVAAEEKERGQLDQIYRRGLENGLPGLRKIGPEEAREIEPHVRAVEAVWVPQAGITDYGLVAEKYAELILAAGGDIFTGHPALRVVEERGTVLVETPDRVFLASLLVTCAGLYSDKIARLTGQDPEVHILPFRGEYYELRPERQHLVRNLIYPVPNPNFPFLGVHFTRMIHGGVEAGPNAVLAFRREGYSRWDLNISELAETLGYSGFQRLARRYWRDGLAEMRRSWFKSHFVKALQHLVPEIRSDDLTPGRSGVRAMACTPDGSLHDDFLILEKPGVINVCNAPSPAATASLAIGETVAERALQQM